ncbi:MAG: bleomycin resistance protein [Thiotrichales bacterium]
MSDFARTIPILASLDLAETQQFYTGALGFLVVWHDDDYLIVCRDEMELHFWRCNDAALPRATGCYIRGGQVPALFEEYERASLGSGRISDFAVRPWNMKEFYIHDPHGNLLKFGCAPEECG